jgi:hypothetical protein
MNIYSLNIWTVPWIKKPCQKPNKKTIKKKVEYPTEKSLTYRDASQGEH